MKALLIAEKPSLMRDIQATYNEHRSKIPFTIDFLAQAGHLVGLMLPSEIDSEKYQKWKLENFPIDVPYKYKVSPGKVELLAKIRKAVNSGNYDFVIHAGDPDQEGELLINLVLNYVGNTLPVKRLWVNAQTHEDILKELLQMKDDSEYRGFYESALVRQHSDYQFGMNITGVTSLKMGELFKLGRVKAAIVNTIVQRDLAIRNFVEKSTWKRSFLYEGCEFINDTVFEQKEDAVGSLPNYEYCTVTQIKDEVKAYKAPKLYKLATLQTDAHKKLGYSSSQTLELLQHLYEAQLVTYPRTSCEYIGDSLDLEDLIHKTAPILGYNSSSFLGRVSVVSKDTSYVNNKAIASEGHTAILPTGKVSFENIGQRERALYELIIRRFLAIFAAPKQIRNLAVVTIPGSDESLGNYIYKESSDISAGYELVLNPKYECKSGKNITFTKGQILKPVEFTIKECVSRPPAKFNEGSLINYLDEIEFKDKNGEKVIYSIGTPATRANIIRECIECGYFVVEKGIYTATEKAIRLITKLGDISLFDIETSGKWEAMLEQIRKQEINASLVEEELLKQCHAITKDISNRTIDKSDARWNSTSVLLGVCPHCNGEIISGKYGAYCKNKCGLQIAKAMGKDLTNTQIKSLLSGKKTLIKGLTSAKTKKNYNAYLTMDGTEAFSYTDKNGEEKNGFRLKFKIEF